MLIAGSVFYTKLAEASPVALRLFAEQGEEQRKRLLAHMGTFIINNYASPDAAQLDERGTSSSVFCPMSSSALTVTLGGHYVLFGVTLEDYAAYAEAIVAAFATVLPATQFTPELASSWRQMVLDVGAEIHRAGNRVANTGRVGTLALHKPKAAAKEWRKVQVKLTLTSIDVYKANNVPLPSAHSRLPLSFLMPLSHCSPRSSSHSIRSRQRLIRSSSQSRRARAIRSVSSVR